MEKSLSGFTRDEVVSHCAKGTGKLIHANKHGPQVMQLSSSIAVKFGFGVTQQEASTQDYVSRHVDRRILIVPRVHDFFTYGSDKSCFTAGYIVMEYIEGDTMEGILEENLVVKVAAAMQHLSTIPIPEGARPGPVPTGEPCGYLWSSYGACTSFTSINDMEAWLNAQLALSKPLLHLDLSTSPLEMRHMDIVRRNIIVTPDHKICFVDWQFAGFYPPAFELVHLKFYQPYDPSFFAALFSYLPELVSEEQGTCFKLLCEIMANNMRFGPQTINAALSMSAYE